MSTTPSTRRSTARSLRSLSLVAVSCALVASGVAACSLFAGSTSTCDLRKSPAAPTPYCWDVENSDTSHNTSYEVLCRGFGGSYQSGTCDRTGAIGGCRRMNSNGIVETRWFYADGKYATLGALAASTECKDGEKPVDQNGVSLDGADLARTLPGPAPTLCSKQSATSIQITFVNNTQKAVRLSWVDYMCAEMDYGEIAPGASKVQQTFTTHPWRLRDSGTLEVVKDVPPFDMAGSYTVMVQ